MIDGLVEWVMLKGVPIVLFVFMVLSGFGLAISFGAFLLDFSKDASVIELSEKEWQCTKTDFRNVSDFYHDPVMKMTRPRQERSMVCVEYTRR